MSVRFEPPQYEGGAAKNRLMAELQDWLRRAGLEVAHADA